MSNKTKKQLLLNLPYFIAGLVCTNLGEAWRIAEGADMSEKLLGFLSALGAAFSNPMPSLHPMDLLIGVCCGAGLRIAVYLKGKNAKKYRHGMEYGSARWGTQKDIEPFEDPVFANNVILTDQFFDALLSNRQLRCFLSHLCLMVPFPRIIAIHDGAKG